MADMSKAHARQAMLAGRRLPPLHSLEVFAAAAKASSFTAASRQLFVTQSAVSRQVQLLEAHLGCRLFQRQRTGLALTAEGQALLPAVQDALARIAQACDSLAVAQHVLTLRLPPTLAARWLLPLLPDLRAELPDMDLRLTTYDAWEPDFERSGVDAAIAYGKGHWPQLTVVPLMPQRLTPVCAAPVAAGLQGPKDLVHLPLLHCVPTDAWPRWLSAAGCLHPGAQRGAAFDTLELALSAATRGQGVAMGDLTLIQESLHDGTLVAPFARTLDDGTGYFLVYPPAKAAQPKIQALHRWLTRQAAALNAAVQARLDLPSLRP